MVKNAYVELLNSKINDLFRDALHKDEENRYSYDLDVPTPHVQGFFDFYLNILNYSPDEIIQFSFGRWQQSNIVDFIFSQQKGRYAFRQEAFDLFKSAFSTYPEVFRYAFNQCLEHLSLEQYAKHGTPSPEQITLVNRNQLLFTQLIEIGKEHQLFHNFSDNHFLTNNATYQQLLEDSGVFTNSFTVDKMLSYLKTIWEHNHSSRSNNYAPPPFFISHLEDIAQLPHTLPDFLDVLKNTPIASPQHESFEDAVKEKNFLPLFLKYFFNINNTKKDISLDPIMQAITSDMDCVSIIFDKPALLTSFLKEYPHHVLNALEHMSIEHDRKFFNIDDKHIFEYEKNGYDHGIKTFLSIYLDAEGYKTQATPPLEHYALYRIQARLALLNNKATGENYFNSFLARYANFSYQHRINSEENDFVYPYYESAKPFFDVLPKMSDLYLKGKQYYNQIHFNKKSNEPFYHYGQLLEQIKKNDIEIYQKIQPKIMSNLQSHLYSHFFQERVINDEHMFNKEYVLPNLAFFLIGAKNDDYFKVLDVLNADTNNPHWLKINHLSYHYNADVKVGKKMRNVDKSRYDLPLAFYLIEATQGKALSWFVQPENLNHFCSIKYNGKNFVSYYHESHWFKDTIIQLGPNKEALTTLVLNNKSAMRAIDKLIENDTSKDKVFNQLFSFYSMNAKIEENEHAHRPGNKI